MCAKVRLLQVASICFLVHLLNKSALCICWPNWPCFKLWKFSIPSTGFKIVSKIKSTIILLIFFILKSLVLCHCPCPTVLICLHQEFSWKFIDNHVSLPRPPPKKNGINCHSNIVLIYWIEILCAKEYKNKDILSQISSVIAQCVARKQR